MTAPRVVCVTQARMTSVRLPGKVMRPILGRPMLAWHLERLKRSTLIDTVAVATVDAPESQPIADLVSSMGLPVTFGSEEDVLGRVHACAAEQRADIVVRVTSDCPLIDPMLVDAAIRRFLDGGFDYLNVDITQYPRGFDAEICTRAALDSAFTEAQERFEREHVMPFLYHRPERFRLGNLGGGKGAGYRLCVDQQEDLDLVLRVCEALHDVPLFGWRDVVDLLDAHPQWAVLNSAVIQKVH